MNDDREKNMYIEELMPGTNLEDYNNEFKGMIDDRQGKAIGWLKTLTAFANTSGGSLYIGVDNRTHEVLSLDHHTVDQITLMISRNIREKVTPPIKYHIDAIPAGKTMPTRYILRVTGQAAQELPVSVHERGLLGIYVRSFGQTSLATPEQIRNMVLMSDSVPYDRPFTTETYRKEDFIHLFCYAEDRDIRITEKSLISCGFMSRDKALSKGAVLFRDDYSASLTRISATLWPGISKGDSVVLSADEFTGNLIDGIRFATEFIAAHSVNGYIKKAEGRESLFSYPERSVLEGVVNAIGHRNYFIDGSQVEINIFRDRLEITSPGALLGVKLMKHETDIASIIPRRRNEVICGILELVRLMEEKGSGFDKIEEDYSRYDKKYAPFVSSSANSFTLTLPDLTYSVGILSGDVLPDIQTDQPLTGRYDARILSFCYNNARTAREIAQHLGLKPSTYLRKNMILPLVQSGDLHASGSIRNERYKSNPETVHLR